MSLLLDTSFVVRAVVTKHPDHGPALAWATARAAETALLCTSHALAETFAVASGYFALSHAECRAVVGSLRRTLGVVDLGEAEVASAIERTMRAGRSGGAVYDALHVAGFEKAGAERLVHCDDRSFPFLLPAAQRINPLADGPAAPPTTR